MQSTDLAKHFVDAGHFVWNVYAPGQAAPKARCDSPQHDDGLSDVSETASAQEALMELPYFNYDVVPFAGQESGSERLFAGQLPYDLSPENVAWLLWLLARVRVTKVEKIVRWTDHQRPCGCFHVYCRPEDAEALLRANQSALCDRGGVWVGRTAAERQWLQSYCADLAANRDSRARLAPHQLVTVQRAKSTYQRPAAMADAVAAPGRVPWAPRPAMFSQVQAPARGLLPTWVAGR